MVESNESYLTVTGMTCATCASTVERVLNKLDPVEEAYVNPVSYTHLTLPTITEV